MSSPTQATNDSSTSDILFATAVVLACVVALAFSIHAFRGRHFHHGPSTVGIERLLPIRPLAVVTLR
ncbi:MAG TPA: hypothetical protein VFE25_13655 [Opitutaceae bacterium]|jgi:hypothetical protein|nr:hypothetical protein [Opitutaceae bacterium]